MSTKFYKGDWALHNGRPGEITLQTGDEVDSWHEGGIRAKADTFTLIRRVSEPEIPAHLPTPPEHDREHHWVYLGNGYKSFSESRYAYYDGVSGFWIESATCEGCDPLHYIELVPNEPHTPPDEGLKYAEEAKASIELCNQAKLLEEAGFTRKPVCPCIDCGGDQSAHIPECPYMNEEFVSEREEIGALFQYLPGEADQLTVEQAVSEYERGAVVFFKTHTKFVILQAERNGMYSFCYFNPNGTRKSTYSMSKYLRNLIAKAMSRGHSIYVTSSRLNLPLFKSHEEK